MLIPPDYTPVQFIIPDDKECSSVHYRWNNIYYTNRDTYSYVSYVSLARKYNLIYAIIKTDNLNLLNYLCTKVPISSAENIDFYKLNKNICLVLKEENNMLEIINASGSQVWLKNGQLHRDNDLPAIIHADGTQKWFKNGKAHRDNDLPAIIETDGRQEWYRNGVKYGNSY